ncbi:MAG: hypothetical protein AB7O50_13140 [Pseudolabrys sp.]
MLADPIFWYGLALKVALTAGIVVAASILVERSGPFIGSLIASLPTAGGAAMIILAVEHTPAFIAQSAVGNLIANASTAVLALVYAALAQRRSLVVSLGGAFVVWFVVIALSRLIEWTAVSAAVFNAVAYPLAIWLSRRYRVDSGGRGKVTLTGADLVWRATIVTVVVIVVTTASHSIGALTSGIFAFFPVAFGAFLIILHTRLGGPAAASVAAHVLTPLIGLGLSFVVVHLLAEPIGVWWSYLAGLSVGIAWNAMLWLVRNRMPRISPAG